jgi:thiaminase/transcriptional activator TenA
VQVTALLAVNKNHLSAILNHDFYRKLTNGELIQMQLGIYLAQDNVYLETVGGVLKQLASSTRNGAAARILRRHSRDAMAAVAQQRGFVRKAFRFGPLLKEEPRPATYAYGNHLRACATQGLAEGAASLVPCYYFYREAVSRLREAGSTDPIFARWIESLPTDELNTTWVQELTGVFEGATKGSRSSKKLERIAFVSGSYETLFLDMAMEDEQWK